MSKNWTVHLRRLLRREWSPPGRREVDAIRLFIAFLCLLVGSSLAVAGERPAIERPVLVDQLPDSGSRMLRSGHFAFPNARRDAPGFAPIASSTPLSATALRQRPASGFSVQLMERMDREANRMEKRDRDNLDRRTPAWARQEDTYTERLKAHYAKRIVTKSFGKALDLQLEHFARTTGGLREAWAWVENLGRQTSSSSLFAPAGGQHNSGTGRTTPPRFSTRVGFKLNAHPKLTLRSELGKIRGRIEIPVRNEPMHITLERQLGPRTLVRLNSGVSRGNGDDWVNLSLRLGF